MAATGPYTATKFLEGEAVQHTNSPFSWFPELENLFRHFDIKELEFSIDKKERTNFIIKKMEG